MRRIFSLAIVSSTAATSFSGPQQVASAVITCSTADIGDVPALRPRTTISRSVTIPANLPPRKTGKAPTSFCAIQLAACEMLSLASMESTVMLITSFTRIGNLPSKWRQGYANVSTAVIEGFTGPAAFASAAVRAPAAPKKLAAPPARCAEAQCLEDAARAANQIFRRASDQDRCRNRGPKRCATPWLTIGY